MFGEVGTNLARLAGVAIDVGKDARHSVLLSGEAGLLGHVVQEVEMGEDESVKREEKQTK